VAVLVPNTYKIVHSPLALWDAKKRVKRMVENPILRVKNNSG
jgi:hypothetical protein